MCYRVSAVWRDLFTDTSEAKVETTLQAMKAIKVFGPSGILSDSLKLAGRTGITQITKVFQQVMESEVCPEQWKDITILPFSGENVTHFSVVSVGA